MGTTGIFDPDEWSFERKRDERAAKEKEIRDNWKEWADKRVALNPKLKQGYEAFANKEAEKAIAKLKER